jgi:hypothetical protein
MKFCLFIMVVEFKGRFVALNCDVINLKINIVFIQKCKSLNFHSKRTLTRFYGNATECNVHLIVRSH